MQDCILQAIDWTGTASFEAFEHDRRTVYAVVRCLEIISEASRRLPEDMLARHREYDWRHMQDAGNVYRHGYDSVLERRVYETVRDFLPPLLVIVQQELAAGTP